MGDGPAQNIGKLGRNIVISERLGSAQRIHLSFVARLRQRYQRNRGNVTHIDVTDLRVAGRAVERAFRFIVSPI